MLSTSGAVEEGVGSVAGVVMVRAAEAASLHKRCAGAPVFMRWISVRVGTI